MTAMLLFLGNLSAGELTVIFLIVLLLFGGNKIPELMRGLGKGIREFNNAKNSGFFFAAQGLIPEKYARRLTKRVKKAHPDIF